MSFTWEAVQIALQHLVVAGSGLAAGKVIWSQQEGQRPTGQYAAMRITDIALIGSDWNDTALVVDPDPGAEVRMISRGPRIGKLSIQCFAGDGVGSGSAFARLHGVVSACAKLSNVQALNDAGVGILKIGDVKSIDGMLGSSFEPRAILELQFALASEVEEFTSNFETVIAQRVDENGDPDGNAVTVSAP